MTKKELVSKIRELLDAAERAHVSSQTIADEMEDILKTLESLPETVEQIEDEDVDVFSR